MPSFYFNAHHDYWPIYAIIQQYYPLGLADSAYDTDFLLRYPGQLQLWDIISERLSNYPQYHQTWKPFQEHLKQQIKKPIHPRDGLTPSYVGYVPLKKRREAGWEYSKELHFAVSFLGPYYTLYGVDFSTLELTASVTYPILEETKDEVVSHRAIHAITVSPYEEYAAIFSALEAAIQAWFPKYRLIPYAIGSMTLPYLAVEGCDQRPAPINAALFHTRIPWLGLSSTQYRGDQYYGSSQWRIS